MTEIQTVPFSGVLKNEHHEASCEGRADKTILRKGSNGAVVAAGFSRFRIERVSKPLPDGVYALAGPGGTRRMRLRNGAWEEMS